MRSDQETEPRSHPSATRGAENTESAIQAAHAVGLLYVSDQQRGLLRQRRGHGFCYRTADGKIVRDRQVLARIKSLAIPPAWTEVWICPEPNGHLQATGRDDRGRKQHRYHRRWREVRDETKFTRMLAFGKALPRIRKRVQQDLRLPGLPRNKVLATVVRLLETSLIRVGNDEYARDNDSFGLTTMRNRHVDVNGSTLRFHFRGKAGKWHELRLRDPKLARIVKKCQDLPGQELFQYMDEQGRPVDVKSSDVNQYLREISSSDFTAKDFRTWSGTVLGALALQEFEAFDTKAQAKKNLVQAIEKVAERLGNTPAVCRKCYIHPEVINAYLEGSLLETLKRKAQNELTWGLRQLNPEEAAVLALLQRRLAAEQRRQNLPKLLQRSIAKAIRKTAVPQRPPRQM